MIELVTLYGLPARRIDDSIYTQGIAKAVEDDYLSIVAIEAASERLETALSYTAPELQAVSLRMVDDMPQRLFDYYRDVFVEKADADITPWNCAGFMLNMLGLTRELYVEPNEAMLGQYGLTMNDMSTSQLESMQPYAFQSWAEVHHFGLGGNNPDECLSVKSCGGPLWYSPFELFTRGWEHGTYLLKPSAQ